MAEHRLIRENIVYLQQAISLLQRVTKEHYLKSEAARYPGSIGKHIRHTTDHYDAFFEGIETGKINYDHRDREVGIETDRAVAIEKLQSLVTQLQNMPERMLAQPVLINSSEGEAHNSSTHWNGSTIARELQFLISHTVHHFALIAIILRCQGLPIDADFGFAQSTIKYERSQDKCAQ